MSDEKVDEKAKKKDEPTLRQIQTTRRRREPLAIEETESYKTRERTGWKPQSEATGVVESWWEQLTR